MQIICHRGFWNYNENFQNTDEQNTLTAFKCAFSNAYGIETDIRDGREGLIVSHDIVHKNSLRLESFFEFYKEFGGDLPLALNIKADGLQILLKQFLESYNIRNYFVFDMSVPDALVYLKHSFRVFTRQSEYEKDPSFYDKACGVWLDEFETHWINENVIQRHLDNGKAVCIVSPELHKRDYEKEWQEYKRVNEKFKTDKLMLCTDYPKEAEEFFNV
ncbi:MAG: hypothetical protein SPF34_00205 [Helicobacter sp.]|uniref:hypothetical protein n=1 Tax=Helicobacter sp. TaxID=218 RepID=UPI002A91E33D|nr:hypothetical protein [Helicobacter sp.]MDY5615325.1 hypothetical protein [Helicobacter sp.]